MFTMASGYLFGTIKLTEFSNRRSGFPEKKKSECVPKAVSHSDLTQTL